MGRNGGAFVEVVKDAFICLRGLTGSGERFLDEKILGELRLPAFFDKGLLHQVLLGERDMGVGIDGEGKEIEKRFALRLCHDDSFQPCPHEMSILKTKTLVILRVILSVDP
jgi:hypothetical protein